MSIADTPPPGDWLETVPDIDAYRALRVAAGLSAKSASAKSAEVAARGGAQYAARSLPV